MLRGRSVRGGVVLGGRSVRGWGGAGREVSQWVVVVLRGRSVRGGVVLGGRSVRGGSGAEEGGQSVGW